MLSSGCEISTDAGVSKTACVEAVLRACEDKQVSFTFIFYQVVVGSQQMLESLRQLVLRQSSEPVEINK